jgi:hypothetical protein
VNPGIPRTRSDWVHLVTIWYCLNCIAASGGALYSLSEGLSTLQGHIALMIAALVVIGVPVDEFVKTYPCRSFVRHSFAFALITLFYLLLMPAIH